MFDGTTGIILNSFNVASITKNGAGDFTVNLTIPAPNEYYAVHLSAVPASNSDSQNDYVTGKGRSLFQISTLSGGVPKDKDTTEVSIFW